MNRCGSFPLLSAPHSLFSFWTDLKRSEKIICTSVEMRRGDLVNWALRTSPKFTTGVKYQLYRDFWPDQRSENHNDPSSPVEENPLINLNQENWTYRSSNPGTHGERQRYWFPENMLNYLCLINLSLYYNNGSSPTLSFHFFLKTLFLFIVFVFFLSRLFT